MTTCKTDTRPLIGRLLEYLSAQTLGSPLRAQDLGTASKPTTVSTAPPIVAPLADGDGKLGTVKPAAPIVASRPIRKTAAPSVFDQSAALFGGNGDVTALQKEVNDLRAQIAQRDSTIAGQRAELDELRATRRQLGELPQSTATAPLKPQSDSAEGNSREALQAAFKTESDPTKRAHIAGQILALPRNVRA